MCDEDDGGGSINSSNNNNSNNNGYVSFLCGIASGVIQAGLFNPWDRALYLSMSNQMPFWSKENFRNPYLGFFQSVGHRALSGGLYYPLENFFCSLLLTPMEERTTTATNNNKNTNGNDKLLLRRTTTTTTGLRQQQQQLSIHYDHYHPALVNFLAGTMAGTCNALIVNPVAAIKYKSWSRPVNRGMLTEAMDMFEKGGLRPFGNGLVPTVYRDLIFGGTYTFLRLELQFRFNLGEQPEHQWIANMTAAALATIVSGPFNLARNVQYATRSKHKADNVSKVLQEFVVETQSQPTLWGKLKFVQRRLRIGWGTVRVAVGMSFGHFVYDRMMGMYQDHQEQQKQHCK
jgi:hypothetical protein